MERIHHVRIVQRVQRLQPINAPPVGPGGHDRVARRMFSDGGRQAHIERLPFLLPPFEHGFIDDFEYRQFRIESFKPRRVIAPEAHEGVLPIGIQFCLAILVVQIHHHQQSRPMKTLDRPVHITCVLLTNRACGLIHYHLGSNAQANMPEPHVADHAGLSLADIVGKVVRILTREAEPAAHIGSLPQPIQAGPRHAARRC